MKLTEEETRLIKERRRLAKLPLCRFCGGQGYMPVRSMWRGCRWCDGSGRLDPKNDPYPPKPL